MNGIAMLIAKFKFKNLSYVWI